MYIEENARLQTLILIVIMNNNCVSKFHTVYDGGGTLDMLKRSFSRGQNIK